MSATTGGCRTKYSRRGIDVDDHLQTSVAGVYAIGDITSQPVPKLTTVAELEADYLYCQLVEGDQQPLRYPTIGTAAFAFPEIAQAGVNRKKQWMIPVIRWWNMTCRSAVLCRFE